LRQITLQIKRCFENKNKKQLLKINQKKVKYQGNPIRKEKIKATGEI
jgi:hypothetical protein